MESQHHIFFSVVIPAHNEELYIGQTLQKLDELDYPKDRFEVIVVENGSSDKTFDVANRYASSRVRVVSIKERGVSRARNYGSTFVHPSAEWVFFMDADIYVEPEFLQMVNMFIQQHSNKNYVAGTCSLLPYPATPVMHFLHYWMNLGFWFFGGAYGGAFFIKRSLLSSLHFDEQLEVGEDMQLAAKAKKVGKLFFIFTPYISASTRRLVQGGWSHVPKLIGMWIIGNVIPEKVRRTFTYKVMR